MKLIGVAGRKFAGKDTFASPLIINNNGGVFNRVRFADPLKNMLRSMFKDAGLDPHTIERMIEGELKEKESPVLKGKTPREAMQTLGTEWRNMISKDLWLGITESRLKKLANGGAAGVVVTDVRFPHEVEFLHRYGATVVRIVGLRKANEHSAHDSESMIDDLDVDCEVMNFGTIADLHEIAIDVASRVTGSNI